jgi:hypothetical protein
MNIDTLEQLAKELEECAGVSWTLFDDMNHRVKVVSHQSYEDAIAFIRRRIDSIKRKQQDADRNT